MEQEIIGSDVVITTKVDLAKFIAEKSFQLEEYQRTITSLTENANAIIAELQALVETSVVGE